MTTEPASIRVDRTLPETMTNRRVLAEVATLRVREDELEKLLIHEGLGDHTWQQLAKNPNVHRAAREYVSIGHRLRLLLNEMVVRYGAPWEGFAAQQPTFRRII